MKLTLALTLILTLALTLTLNSTDQERHGAGMHELVRHNQDLREASEVMSEEKARMRIEIMDISSRLRENQSRQEGETEFLESKLSQSKSVIEKLEEREHIIEEKAVEAVSSKEREFSQLQAYWDQELQELQQSWDAEKEGLVQECEGKITELKAVHESAFLVRDEQVEALRSSLEGDFIALQDLADAERVRANAAESKCAKLDSEYELVDSELRELRDVIPKLEAEVSETQSLALRQCEDLQAHLDTEAEKTRLKYEDYAMNEEDMLTAITSLEAQCALERQHVISLKEALHAEKEKLSKEKLLRVHEKGEAEKMYALHGAELEKLNVVHRETSHTMQIAFGDLETKYVDSYSKSAETESEMSTQIAELSGRAEALSESNLRLEGSLEKLNEALAAKGAEASASAAILVEKGALLDEKEEMMSKLEQEKEEMMSKLEQEKEEMMSKLEQEKEEMMSKLEQEKEEMMSKLEQEKEEMMSKLEQEIVSKEEEINALRDQHVEEVDQVRRVTVELANSERDEAIEKMQGELERLTKDTESSMKET